MQYLCDVGLWVWASIFYLFPGELEYLEVKELALLQENDLQALTSILRKPQIRALHQYLVAAASPESPRQPPTLQPSPTLQPTALQPPTLQPPALQPPALQPPTFQLLTLQPTTLQPTTLQPLTPQSLSESAETDLSGSDLDSIDWYTFSNTALGTLGDNAASNSVSTSTPSTSSEKERPKARQTAPGFNLGEALKKMNLDEPVYLKYCKGDRQLSNKERYR